jgi:hypothetical protein
MKFNKFQYLIPAVMFFINPPIFGQIVQKTTDSNYYNTTVVYVKENTSGIDLLNAVEGDFGMGDLVRIEIATQAPPTASPAPSPKLAVPNQVPFVVQNNQRTVQKTVPTPVAAPEKTKVVQPAPMPEPKPVVRNAPKKVNEGQKKAVKRKKCKSRPPYMASVKRKKHGKQRYGCPKF